MAECILAYRMTSDTGCAPCVFKDNFQETELLTLACCKGGCMRKDTKVFRGLRVTAQKLKQGGNIVLIMGIYKNHVLYVAEISDVITMNEYYSQPEKYGSRVDFIYDVGKEENGFFLKRNNRNKHFHPIKEKTLHQKDELGKYVLMSNCFAYFGKQYILNLLNPNERELMPKKQETKTYISNDDTFNVVKALYDKTMANKMKLSKPLKPCDELTQDCKGCNQK